MMPFREARLWPATTSTRSTIRPGSPVRQWTSAATLSMAMRMASSLTSPTLPAPMVTRPLKATGSPVSPIVARSVPEIGVSAKTTCGPCSASERSRGDMPDMEKSMVRRPLASRRVTVAVEVQRAPEPEASRSISRPPAGGAVMSKSMPAKTKRLPDRTSSTMTVPLRRPKPVRRWPSRPDRSIRSSQMPRRRNGESSGSGSDELASAGGGWPPDSEARPSSGIWVRKRPAARAIWPSSPTFSATEAPTRSMRRTPKGGSRMGSESSPSATRGMDTTRRPSASWTTTSRASTSTFPAASRTMTAEPIWTVRPSPSWSESDRAIHGVTMSSPMPPRWICQPSTRIGQTTSRRKAAPTPVHQRRRVDQQDTGPPHSASRPGMRRLAQRDLHPPRRSSAVVASQGTLPWSGRQSIPFPSPAMGAKRPGSARGVVSPFAICTDCLNQLLGSNPFRLGTTVHTTACILTGGRRRSNDLAQA